MDEKQLVNRSEAVPTTAERDEDLLRRSIATDGQVGVFSWEADVPLVTLPLVRRQLLLVAGGTGLFMAFLLSFIFATTGEFEALPMMLLISLGAAVGLGLFLFLVALLVFGNRLRLRFTIDDTGAVSETVDKRARTGSRLALLAGLLGGSPSTAGAGALGMARETETVRWEDVADVDVDPRHRTVILRGSWRPILMLVCLPEDFDRVSAYVRARITPQPAEARPSRRSRLPVKGLLHTGLVALAAAPVFALASYPFDLDLLLPLIWFVFALATVWLIPLFGWVVIACSVLLGLQIGWIGAAELAYVDGIEQVAFFLAYVGLALMVALAWRALRGKLVSPLMEP